MYLQMYGFAEKPFHITPNPRFIFLSKNHKEAFAHLLYGIQQRVGFLSLTGEVGTGKTTVLRTLLGQLEESDYRVALIFNPCLSALEMLQTIHREFDIDFDSELTNLIPLHDSLNRFLLQQSEAGKTVVLVVDEAQNLDPVVLEQLRLLSNLETETEKLIQMVLVGQPELDEILQRNDLRQLRQRLAVRYQLRPMDSDDTAHYVAHRVRIAGCLKPALFTAQALEQIYRFSKGTPRLINILSDRALLVAYGRDAESVSKQDVKVAQQELQHDSLRRPRIALFTYSILFAAIILFAGLKLFSQTAQHSPPLVDEQRDNGSSIIIPPAPQLPPAVTEPQAQVTVVETINKQRLTELKQTVAALTTEESGLQSVLALAELWQRPLPSRLPAVSHRAKIVAALGLIGFDLVEINVSVPELLRLDAPAVLEINLPNVAGKRFIAVSHYRAGQIKTIPALTESGWLGVAELSGIWFGKALLPFMNYQGIPLLDRPDATGSKVEALQQILTELDADHSVSSGIYDKQTIDIVTDYQLQRQLTPDGRVGSQTLFWLYRDIGREMPRLSDGEGS